MKLQQLVETQTLAIQLMNEYGLVEQGWTFKFANDKRTIGWCKHRTKTIEISKYYLDSHTNEIRDTILHEIAHALVGPNHGHDRVWRMKCIEIGANPSRTTDIDKVVFNGQYTYTVGCNNEDCSRHWEYGKHRLKQAYYNYQCKHCKGPLFIRNNKTGEITYTTPVGW